MSSVNATFSLKRTARKSLHLAKDISASFFPGLFALPDFLVIGMAKAGTTSLYSQIIEHPEILPARVKEIHYFDWKVKTEKPNWYHARFPPRSRMKGKITGEATPDYILHPHAAKRIHALVPNVKIILLCRNPTERAISHYFFTLNHEKLESRSLKEAIFGEEERIGEIIKRMEADPSFIRPEFFNFSYAYRGLYHYHLQKYLELFPRESIFVGISEEYLSEPQSFLREIYTFLGIDPDFRNPDLSSKNVGKKGDVDLEVRQFLDEKFAEPNQKLSEFLGRDLPW